MPDSPKSSVVERNTVGVAKKLSRTLLGFILLSLVVVIWVGSGAVIQVIYRDMDYDKPVFLSFFSIACSVVMFLAPTSWKLVRSGALTPSHATEAFSFPARSHVLVLSGLWILMHVTYNISLKYTAVSVNTCLSTTSSVFTFLFSLLLLKKAFRVWSAAGVLLGIAGVVVTMVAPPEKTDERAMDNTTVGCALALVAACFYGIFTSSVKKWVADESHMVLIFGMFGVAAVIVGAPVLGICHLAGWEEFQMPTLAQFGAITANALVGSVISDLFLSFVVILLSPLVACIGLTCTIPLSCLVDACLFQYYDFSPWFLVGAVLVFGAVVTVSLDQQRADAAAKKAAPPVDPKAVYSGNVGREASSLTMP